MKDEGEIYKEWYEIYFEEPPDPLEYMYYRETLAFQRYLLSYRGKELVQTILENLSFKKARTKNDTCKH